MLRQLTGRTLIAVVGIGRIEFGKLVAFRPFDIGEWIVQLLLVVFLYYKIKIKFIKTKKKKGKSGGRGVYTVNFLLNIATLSVRSEPRLWRITGFTVDVVVTALPRR